MNNMRKITSRGVVLHEGKLLAVRLNQYTGALPGAGGYWCIPGGKLDAGESLEACAEREMLEETGVPAQIGQLLYVQQFSFNDSEYVEFFFHVTNTTDYLDIDLSKSSHGGEEIAEIGFIDPSAVDIKPLFFATEDLAAAATDYQGPKFFNYG